MHLSQVSTSLDSGFGSIDRNEPTSGHVEVNSGSAAEEREVVAQVEIEQTEPEVEHATREASPPSSLLLTPFESLCEHFGRQHAEEIRAEFEQLANEGQEIHRCQVRYLLHRLAAFPRDTDYDELAQYGSLPQTGMLSFDEFVPIAIDFVWPDGEAARLRRTVACDPEVEFLLEAFQTMVKSATGYVHRKRLVFVLQQAMLSDRLKTLPLDQNMLQFLVEFVSTEVEESQLDVLSAVTFFRCLNKGLMRYAGTDALCPLLCDVWKFFLPNAAGLVQDAFWPGIGPSTPQTIDIRRAVWLLETLGLKNRSNGNKAMEILNMDVRGQVFFQTFMRAAKFCKWTMTT